MSEELVREKNLIESLETGFEKLISERVPLVSEQMEPLQKGLKQKASKHLFLERLVPKRDFR